MSGAGNTLPQGLPVGVTPSLGGECLEAAQGAGLCVGQSAQEPAQADAQAGMLSKAFGVDGPIDPAVWGAYADSLPRPTSAVGVWFLGGDGGQDVLVVGGDRYTLNQLRLHGCLSQSDVELMGYVGRYMRGAAGAVQRPVIQDTDEASAPEGACNVELPCGCTVPCLAGMGASSAYARTRAQCPMLTREAAPQVETGPSDEPLPASQAGLVNRRSTMETLTAVVAADEGTVVTELAVTYFKPEKQARAAQVVLVLQAVAMANACQVAEVARVLKGMGVEVGS